MPIIYPAAALVLCSIINAGIQLLLKRGTAELEDFNFSLTEVWPLITSVVLNPFIVSAVLLQVISLGLFLFLMSRFEVSFAGPILALSYLFIALGAYLFMGESVSALRMIGIGVIILGVCLVARS